MIEPSISACICTKDRPDALKRLLCSLPFDDPHLFEVIISDDGSDVKSREIVHEFDNTMWLPGPRRGVSANRNTVVAHARGTFIWMLDDDAVVSPACFREFVQYLDRLDGDQRAIISGKMVEPDGRVIEPHKQSLLGFQAKQYLPGDHRSTVVLGNCIFPKSLFVDIHFDETLQAVFEEVDLTTRAAARGYTLFYCPAAVAAHLPPGKVSSHARYGREIDVARIYVTTKRHALTDRRPVAAALYLLLATTHMLLSHVKRGGVGAVPGAVTGIYELITRLYRTVCLQHYAPHSRTPSDAGRA